MRIQNGGWGTPTTQGVFNEVLPRGMYIEGCKTMRLVVQTAEGTRKYLLPEGGLVLTRERIPQNPEREKSYAINRRKNKEVMRQYSNFFAWAKGYLSLRDHVIPVKETDAVYASAYKDYEFVQSLCIHHIFRAEKKVAARAMLLNMIVNKEEENYEDYINAVALFARIWGCFTFNNGQGHRLTLDNLKKCIVKLHLPEVVKVTVLPAGQEAKRSPYAKWMNGWIKDVYTTNNTTTTALTAQTTA
jgi:hypothetical protein